MVLIVWCYYFSNVCVCVHMYYMTKLQRVVKNATEASNRISAHRVIFGFNLTLGRQEEGSVLFWWLCWSGPWILFPLSEIFLWDIFFFFWVMGSSISFISFFYLSSFQSYESCFFLFMLYFVFLLTFF